MKKKQTGIVERRASVARLYLGGLTQVEVAERLGVTVVTVSADLRALREEWREKAQGDVQARIDEALAKLDALEREACEAWERSKSVAPLKSVKTRYMIERTKGKGGAKGKSKLTPIEKQISVTEREGIGDPRFLERIEKVRLTRMKLLGMLKDETSQTVVLNWDQLIAGQVTNTATATAPDTNTNTNTNSTVIPSTDEEKRVDQLPVNCRSNKGVNGPDLGLDNDLLEIRISQLEAISPGKKD